MGFALSVEEMAFALGHAGGAETAAVFDSHYRPIDGRQHGRSLAR